MKEFKVIFWDFDGVIKDSVKVKSEAYIELFEPYDSAIADRIRKHHEANGGISRYEKVPLYLEWAGLQTTAANINNFCAKFSTLVFQAVIDAPWVPGVKDYLLAHYQQQVFILVSATPNDEIVDILEALEIFRLFQRVYGAPTPKDQAIAEVLKEQGCPPGRALMIGDSESDMMAAQTNRVSFLLRRTAENHALQNRFVGPKIDDFLTPNWDILWTD